MSKKQSKKREMYDIDGTKERFIKTIDDSKIHKNFDKVAGAFFESVKGYEELLGKDLRSFTIEEITEMYKYVSTPSLERLMNMNSLFRRYCYFCIENGYVIDGINHYEEANNEVIFKCVDTSLETKVILTREELLKAISLLLNPCDKFLILSIFEGVAGTGMADIAELRPSDFFDNEVKLKSDRVLEVSKELRELAILSADAYEYNAYTDIGAPARLKFKEEDPYVLKEMSNVVHSDLEHRKFNLSRSLMKLKKAKKFNAFSYGHLTDSGKIDLIKKFMAKDKTDARTAIQNHREEIANRYTDIVSIRRFLLKYSDFLN